MLTFFATFLSFYLVGSTGLKWVGLGKMGSVDFWKIEGPAIINQLSLCQAG